MSFEDYITVKVVAFFGWLAVFSVWAFVRHVRKDR